MQHELKNFGWKQLSEEVKLSLYQAMEAHRVERR
jgi:hypothetical protein